MPVIPPHVTASAGREDAPPWAIAIHGGTRRNKQPLNWQLETALQMWPKIGTLGQQGERAMQKGRQDSCRTMLPPERRKKGRQIHEQGVPKARPDTQLQCQSSREDGMTVLHEEPRVSKSRGRPGRPNRFPTTPQPGSQDPAAAKRPGHRPTGS